MKNDYLKWGALAAALVATASAEYELARAVGFNQWVAAAVPAALDLYTVRALRAHREVLAAVAAMIGVNAASHLVTTGLVPVNVWLVVAVAAIAPLVLWRVHSLAIDVTAPVYVERVEDERPTGPVVPAPVVIPAERTLTAAPFLWDSVAPPKALPVTTSVPAETAREVVTEVVALSPAELRRKARRMNKLAVMMTKRPVTIKALQDELGLSRRDATDLRREVVTP
ncbi:hypothetical protein [Streptomyces parvulus]|uniref:Uncharacterized protein n=1 Tax=Streptomyces parvulus TaxID=146923 RepID=A0A191UWV3_9ACTN|nr:hypothetical protein [Streptomyces parvulus]ANJ07162.1 hypothetical protein Spa2297_09180 [Streptomyces parvulus]GGR74291.1 hypothetical protein GCM10010220_28230 [Streptomyces parvulus]